LGFGTLPTNGQLITVQGISLLSTAANFGCGTLVAGSQAGYEGVVVIPSHSEATVAVATTQLPTVTASTPSTAVSTSSVTLENTNSVPINANYAIW
jgi:hypothetical protein